MESINELIDKRKLSQNEAEALIGRLFYTKVPPKDDMVSVLSASNRFDRIKSFSRLDENQRFIVRLILKNQTLSHTKDSLRFIIGKLEAIKEAIIDTS